MRSLRQGFFATSCALATALALGATPASGDTIHLADGRVLEGTVQRHPDGQLVDIRISSTSYVAILTLPAAQVVRIDPGPGPNERALADIQARRDAITEATPIHAQLDLARQARAIGDETLARHIIDDALAREPGNAEAHQMLGEMFQDGVWMTVPEAMMARGYVLYDQRWMPKAEAQRLQAEADQRRADEDAARQAREAQERRAASPYAQGGDGYTGYMGLDPSGYDWGGDLEGPWGYGGAVIIGGHHHRGFGTGFRRCGTGFGVRAGGFGVVVGRR